MGSRTGGRRHDWSAASQEKLNLGTSQLSLHYGPSSGRRGEGEETGRSRDDGRAVGDGEVKGGGPFLVSVSLPSHGKDKHGQGRKGEKEEMCSPAVLGELSWEMSQLPLIKQAKRTRGEAVL